MKFMKVAIQGIEGCFHQEAANNYFRKKITPICCMTFSELIKKVQINEADYGIMAIENSIAGSILPNYNILMQSKLSVIGEYYLYISQNLMALPGKKLNEISIVMSHPMAIYQCNQFLSSFSFRLIEKEDTAVCAKIIYEKKLQNTAAIGSKLASELYKLEILKSNIQTNKNNYTRFVVVGKQEEVHRSSNKASICFTTHNTPGSLASILNIITEHGINLSKLQSNPIIGQQWEYFFFADLENITIETYNSLVSDLKKRSINIIELGIYKNGLQT